MLNTGKEGFGQPDPLAPKRRVKDDPEVQQLRAHLKANNGIQMLEICEPHELDRIRTIYCRDGFGKTIAAKRHPCLSLLPDLT